MPKATSSTRIENVTGSAHDDDLWGNDGVNVLAGNDGNDTAQGLRRRRHALRRRDNDAVGDDGNDGMRRTGDDYMIGGDGADTFIVDSAADIDG